MNGPRTPRVTLILARARNGVIGAKGGLPWHLPEDLAFFKRTTMGHPIVMGRKTWESIGRPLPGRRGVVVTRDRRYSAPGAETVHSLDEAIERCRDAEEIFVIGGAQLYAEALPRADRLYLTRVQVVADGDARFPEPDPACWQRTASEPLPAGDPGPLHCVFETWQRR